MRGITLVLIAAWNVSSSLVTHVSSPLVSILMGSPIRLRRDSLPVHLMRKTLCREWTVDAEGFLFSVVFDIGLFPGKEVRVRQGC